MCLGTEGRGMKLDNLRAILDRFGFSHDCCINKSLCYSDLNTLDIHPSFVQSQPPNNDNSFLGSL